MNTSSYLADVVASAVAVTTPLITTMRSIATRPFTIDRLDASATLWPPVVPEEADPPRWRLELLETRQSAGRSA